MKPDFALSLSFDGIRLLHRAAGGWRLVGDVALDDPDMSSALEVLRRTAKSLKTAPLRTKLIIPDTQIKYLSIETGDLSDDARKEAARLALDGATPYEIDALVFDISSDGTTTHIAAVARDTLAEAEAFASEHAFKPVSFVAAPETSGFLGEPFFGKTSIVASLIDADPVEPDGIKVVVIGDIEVPDGPVVGDAPDTPVAAQTPDTVQEAYMPPVGDRPEGVEPAQELSRIDPPSTSIKDTQENQTKAQIAPLDDAQEPPPAAEPQPVPDTAPSRDVQSARVSAPEIEVPEPRAPSAAQSEPTMPPTTGFASRRKRGGKAALLVGVTRDRVPTPPQRTEPPAPKPPSQPKPSATTPPLPRAAADSLRPLRTASAPAPEPVHEPSDRGAGFMSRRKPPPSVVPEAAAATATTMPAKADAEAQRMTVFGARRDETVGGKPRYLGLILTAILIICLAGVAAWASLFLDDGFARLFPPRERTLASTLPDDTQATIVEEVGATTETEGPEGTDGVVVAALNESLDTETGLSAEDAAVLDALRDPLPNPVAPEELDAAALDARYAVTGIWPKAPPDVPLPAEPVDIDGLYVTGIDPVSPALDAVALQSPGDFLTDGPLALVTSPVAAGTQFARDAAGRIVATVEGALDPDGFTVFLGRPPVVPPVVPARLTPEDGVEATATDTIAIYRPRIRPTDLVEQNERASLGGLSRTELASYRPRLRPEAPQEVLAAPEPDADTPASEAEVSALAAAQSLRPEARPRNFDRIVARTQSQQQRSTPASASTAAVASVAPRTVTPNIPSTASVAREATVSNAINLRRVNLIGVYGTPSDRRALVRLANGRYQKVQVGDRFDGGRVSAIGDNELRYQKGGRNLVLKMPSG